jgi:hypothetical protein
MTRISREQQDRTRGPPRLRLDLNPSVAHARLNRPETAGCCCRGSGQLGRERERRNLEGTRLSADGAIPLRFSPSRRARQRDKTSHGSGEMRRSESDLTERADTFLAQVPKFRHAPSRTVHVEPPHSVRFSKPLLMALGNRKPAPKVDETKHGAM